MAGQGMMSSNKSASIIWLFKMGLQHLPYKEGHSPLAMDIVNYYIVSKAIQ